MAASETIQELRDQIEELCMALHYAQQHIESAELRASVAEKRADEAEAVLADQLDGGHAVIENRRGYQIRNHRTRRLLHGQDWFKSAGGVRRWFGEGPNTDMRLNELNVVEVRHLLLEYDYCDAESFCNLVKAEISRRGEKPSRDLAPALIDLVPVDQRARKPKGRK